MLCQHCNKNEAHYYFLMQGDHLSGEIYLCVDCAEQLGRQYQAHMNGWMAAAGRKLDIWPFDQEEGGWELSGRFPEGRDEQFARRRELSELRATLRQAVDKEDYEAAARIRDEINRATISNAIMK